MIYFRGMKTLLFFISFLVTVPSICLSQDLIISKTQDTIPCKIWSIGDAQIKIDLMDNVDTTAVKRSHYTEYFRKGNWHLLERRTPTPKANNPASKNLYPAIGNDFLAAGNSLIIGSLLGLSGAVLAGLGGIVNANGSKTQGLP